MKRLELRFDDVDALERELEGQWAHGRAIVPGQTGLDPFMPCELVLHHPNGGDPLAVGATVVASPEEQVRDGRVRLMLDDGTGPALREFVERRREPGSATSQSAAPPAIRLRELSMADQVKLARTSPSLTERTVLERMLGKPGWEQLLVNPHITVPEIARIARKGTVPRPLLEQIIDQAAWSRNATVRRALLSNPKLTHELILKVLRHTPAHELKLVPKQTAYPAAVRMVARQLLGGA